MDAGGWKSDKPDDPFVSTYVASETGVGHGSAPGRTYDLNGKPLVMSIYEVSAVAQYRGSPRPDGDQGDDRDDD
jgi:hypothetical protein